MRVDREQIVCCLAGLASHLPTESANWVRALLAETPQADSTWCFMTWIAGAAVLLLRFHLKALLASEDRPFAVSAASGYLFTFAAYLFIHTAWQLPAVHESWSIAWFPVLACLCLTLVPAVIGYGLWTCDALARRLTIAFVSLDLLQTSYFIHHYSITPFRAFKLICDLLIVVAMFSPAVRKLCCWPDSGESTVTLRTR